MYFQHCKRRKAVLTAEYDGNTDTNRKQRKSRSSSKDLDKLVFIWIQDANFRKISLTRLLIQESAGKFAKDLGMSDFKGSNGCLEKFLKRHQLHCRTMTGERGDVPQESIDSWKERLGNIVAGYELCDIFNMDESDIFFKMS